MFGWTRDQTLVQIDGPTDVYAVVALEEPGAYQVKHFPTLIAPRPCCTVTVWIADHDRAEAFDFERVKGMTAAMHRAYVAIEQRHVGTVRGAA